MKRDRDGPGIFVAYDIDEGAVAIEQDAARGYLTDSHLVADACSLG